ncbi:SRPBCC domain-containing protein [Marinibactrum halimedae]|uniref:SRPBCC domain-containing protein n=1 Tax=Marinibactrum halimedae TaxID=1444977 RepID=A0AA37T490_9GAMM|nr:SRPBCC domain-containing protein [Marinibactrum halimedae]MCD9459042.1 SRPBCC domain-containing protein [Marinibactrum halimedae]GLS26828.1 hypothetical protein GCM10007877_25470 [Marinibactrum halimedae]
MISKWVIGFIIVLVILVVLYVLGRKSVHSEVFIPVSPDKVWSVIVDTQKYPEWNPVMEVLDGELKEGQTVRYRFHQDEDNSYEIPSKVKKIEPSSLLNQTGGMVGMLTFNHRYVLTPESNGTRVVIHEDYRGVGAAFWNPAPVGAAYERLNQAIKVRATALYLPE